MEKEEYPGLYRAADRASEEAQFAYLRAVRCHILMLILGAVLTINPQPSAIYSLANAIVFLIALGISIFIAVKGFERSWYSARAVAESVKTATWRYMMRAEPFLDASSIKNVNQEFRVLLQEILKSNNQIGDLLGGQDCAREQVSQSMTNTRKTSLELRKSFYLDNRISEQRSWYARKSEAFKKKNGQLFILLVTLQALAVFCVLIRIAYPSWTIWPTNIFVVSAGGVTTWIQLKRYKELATAYALTAHEIGITEGRINESETDSEFSDFVRDTENAFSREHTQWIAKQEKEI